MGQVDADIYTECVREQGNAERLTFRAGDAHIHLWGEDRVELEQLISDTQRL